MDKDIKYIKNVAKFLSGHSNVGGSPLPDSFPSVWEGVAETDSGEIFYVSIPTIENTVSSYNIQRPDNTFTSICTDCNRLYLVDYIENDILVYTIESLTDTPPATDWIYSTGGVPSCICCDGNRVFVGNTNSGVGEPMVESWLPDGTSYLAYDEAGTNPVVDMASNGQYLIVLVSGVANKAMVLSASDITYVDHSAIAGLDDFSSVCISYDRYFITVNDGVGLGRQLKSYAFNGAELETLGSIPVDVNPQSRMCFDGEALFVHIDGILYRYEYRYISLTGTWQNANIASSCSSICVDDRYVYLWDGINDFTLAVDKYTGKLKWHTAEYEAGPVCSDGVNTYSVQVSFPSGENYINKIPSRTSSKLFRNVSGQGVNRKYYTLANPV